MFYRKAYEETQEDYEESQLQRTPEEVLVDAPQLMKAVEEEGEEEEEVVAPSSPAAAQVASNDSHKPAETVAAVVAAEQEEVAPSHPQRAEAPTLQVQVTLAEEQVDVAPPIPVVAALEEEKEREALTQPAAATATAAAALAVVVAGVVEKEEIVALMPALLQAAEEEHTVMLVEEAIHEQVQEEVEVKEKTNSLSDMLMLEMQKAGGAQAVSVASLVKLFSKQFSKNKVSSAVEDCVSKGLIQYARRGYVQLPPSSSSTAASATSTATVKSSRKGRAALVDLTLPGPEENILLQPDGEGWGGQTTQRKREREGGGGGGAGGGGGGGGKGAKRLRTKKDKLDEVSPDVVLTKTLAYHVRVHGKGHDIEYLS